MAELSAVERRVLQRLSTPAKVQDFLNTLPFNFEANGDTCLSPRRILREKRAHCMEGALLAAAAFWVQGERPLVLDLKAADPDDDHVVALFRRYGRWGAVSKTNHAVLRYREPVYRTVRELALSYFHEYFLHDGRKTMRRYSARPFDLARFRSRGWMTAEDDLWYIPEAIDRAPHVAVLSPGARRTLRRADAVEISAGRITEWPTPRGRRRR